MFGKINANAPVNLASDIGLLTISGQVGSITPVRQTSQLNMYQVFRKGIKNVQYVWMQVGNEKEHQKGQKEQGQEKEITT
jgi:hypothetical protein